MNQELSRIMSLLFESLELRLDLCIEVLRDHLYLKLTLKITQYELTLLCEDMRNQNLLRI